MPPRPEDAQTLPGRANSFYPPDPEAVFIPEEAREPKRNSVDRELAERAMRGDARALETVLRALTPALLTLATRISRDANFAEDLVTEALYRGAVKLKKLKDPAAIEPWFRRILVNLWRDEFQRRRPRDVCLADLPDPPAPDSSAPEARTEAMEIRGAVQGELENLPPMQRAAMALELEEGLGVAEIAELLRSTPSRVKANLWHARKRLRERLSKRWGMEEAP
jgi:RNA polymerase sigma-70 factor (ECF subfamily)